MKTVCQWCKLHIKPLFQSTKEDRCQREIRKALERAIRTRNTAIRQRLEMDRALDNLYNAMEACGCGVCRHGDVKRDEVSENRHVIVARTTEATTTSITLTQSDCGQGYDDHAISGVEHELEHEPTHNEDIPGNCHESTQVVVLINSEDIQGKKSVPVKHGLKCEEHAHLRTRVDCLEKTIGEMNEVVRSFNDFIIGSGRQMQSLHRNGNTTHVTTNEEN